VSTFYAKIAKVTEKGEDDQK